jgi:transposase-like protein
MNFPGTSVAEIRYTVGMMRKRYAAAFKARVVQELLKEEKMLAQIAAEYEVHKKN